MAIEKSPRFDLTFSYWIFVWFLIYYCVSLASFYTTAPSSPSPEESKDSEDEKTWTIPNPKIWLIIGLSCNFAFVTLMIYYRASLRYIFMFLFINCIIKMIPIWLLRDTPWLWRDFWAGVALFITYLGWLMYNGKTYASFMQEGVERIKQNKPVGPFMYQGNRWFPQGAPA